MAKERTKVRMQNCFPLEMGDTQSKKKKLKEYSAETVNEVREEALVGRFVPANQRRGGVGKADRSESWTQM